MKTNRHSGAAMLLLLWAIAGWNEICAQDNSAYEMVSVQITVSGFENTDGQAILNIFKTSEGFPGDISRAFKSIKEKVTGDKVVFNIEIPVGVYAFSCIHDENRNNAMDKNLIGLPKEGAGLSNYKEGGYPSFNKAKMSINTKSHSLTININYL
jgi:uncharacterized protein (DUF2141 family)